MEYELRDLKSKDVFPMFKIIGKIGINEFKTCFESDAVKTAIANAKSEGEKELDLGAIGYSVVLDIANVVIEHIPDAEQEIYSFLAGLSGMKKSEIADLPIGVFLNMLIDIFKKDEFKDFFEAASRLLK